MKQTGHTGGSAGDGTTNGFPPHSLSVPWEFEPPEVSFDCAPDLVCLSHLRWDWVFQRPQHLMTRCARERRVFYVEEPVSHDGDTPALEMSLRDNGVCVVIPKVPARADAAEETRLLEQLMDDLLHTCGVRDYILWYYTPMALPWTRRMKPLLRVYDCMDELSSFAGAPAALRDLETEMFERAGLVFTGGQSLYEAKSNRHPSVHAFPSSIDVAHFGRARREQPEPADQAAIPRPRIGYSGVIDERMDYGLIDGIAAARPDWQLVMIGPVAKVDPATLPRRPNIHWLGKKSYSELPAYLAGWDAALIPFARNDATRFISPTKTPEYLAAGRPVVSTSIRDVVTPYGQKNLVTIADTVEETVAALGTMLARRRESPLWLRRVDEFLARNCWDRTWAQMMQLLEEATPLPLTVARPIARRAAPASTPAIASIEEETERATVLQPVDPGRGC